MDFFDREGSYEKKGYLYDDFKMFTLMGKENRTYEYHYHDFCKLLIFLNGDVTYSIEGKSYKLKPFDYVLVDKGAIHKPRIAPDEPYERVVFYISDEFFNHLKEEGCDLHYCYEKAKEEGVDVLRFPAMQNTRLRGLLDEMRKNSLSGEYASKLYGKVLFTELMILLNRGSKDGTGSFDHAVTYNQKMIDLLCYIGEHLAEELSVEDLANRFYISKYHMMRRFRAETGYTIHAYLVSKRLVLAREQIASGMPVLQAAAACGFGDYSAFCRAYRRQFGQPPSSARESGKKSQAAGKHV